MLESIFSGVASSFLYDWIKSAGSKNDGPSGCWKVIGCLFWLLVSLVVVIIILSTCTESRLDKKKEAREYEWQTTIETDSVFMLHDRGIVFYKKGKKELNRYEQRAAKYRRRDTVDFFPVNKIDDEYFYVNRTSFVGICLGTDTTKTDAGKYNEHRWVVVKPADGVKEWRNAESSIYGEYGKWADEDEHQYYGVLEKGFYVKFEDVTISNNDSLFR